MSEVSKKIGSDTWTWIKEIWQKLVSRSSFKTGELESETDLVKAATEVANNPSDKDAQAALRLQIKKLLLEDSTLLQEIQYIINQVEMSQSSNTETQTGGIRVQNSNIENTGNIVGGDQHFH
ncbi:Hypothetical protein CKA32_006075 [Geitlerinema sp. FC II]|nr:Hypothetical protein CKA32_006075 [Geitlerinema sp. FC II]